MIKEYRSKIEQAKGSKASAQKRMDSLVSDIKSLSELVKVQEEVSILVQQTAKETQEQLKFHLIDIVQSAVDSIFPEVYTFHIEFDLKRGRTEASIFLDKDGDRINPMDSSGGGVVDIVSFALRVGCWSIGNSTNTILMDEPLKWLSDELKPLAGDIIKGLSKKLNLQMIIVTHDLEMVSIADRIIKVDQKCGKSFVKITDGEEEQ